MNREPRMRDDGQPQGAGSGRTADVSEDTSRRPRPCNAAEGRQIAFAGRGLMNRSGWSVRARTRPGSGGFMNRRMLAAALLTSFGIALAGAPARAEIILPRAGQVGIGVQLQGGTLL